MPGSTRVNDLKQLELFEDLSLEVLEKIEPYFHKRFFERNSIVYTNAAEAQHFIFLLKGKIKIYRLSELGREQIIRLIEPKAFTGELALFEGVRKAYATALEASTVYIISHSDFKKVLASYPALYLKMIEILAYRLHLSEEQTSYLSTSTAKERLWIYLNKEAKEVDGKQIVHHTETKRVVAAYLGMSSETLSRVLHQLEVEGRVKRLSDHQLEIIDNTI